MRRLLTSLLVALLVSAALPLTVLGATQASAGTATTNEDTAVTITLTARDQSNGLPITQFAPAAAGHGTVGAPGPITCDAGGAHRCHSDVLYTPTANYNGTDAFNFTATGPDGPDTATVTITINPVNDAPACSGDVSTGDEDTGQSGTVACTDVDGNLLTYSKVASPAHGNATVNTNGSWTYTPAANYNGTDDFTFRANDGTLNSNTASMSLTISSVNDAPVCADDASIGDKNQQQTGTIVCADVDDANLTIAKVSGPSHGSASVATDGDWTYTPTTNFSGSDDFTFRASDGSLNSNNATMQLTISATNAAPLCSAGTSSGPEDADQTGTVACTDADDDPLTYSKGTGPSHGTATVNPDGSWTYSPAADYNGPDSFTFRATDDSSASSVAVAMSITVTPVNDAPVCADDAHSGNEDAGQSGSLSCTDVDNDPLTYTKVAGPSDGGATVDPAGSWTYTPDADFNGADSFTFSANDGTVDSNTATLTIAVNNTNDAPVCSADSSSGAEDADQTGTLSCTDLDSDPLNYSKVADPSYGSLTVHPNGSWTYVPDPNFNGADSFTFLANDGTGPSNTVTMSITVTAVNDAPVCADDSHQGNEDVDQTATITCTDAEGDALTYAKVGGPSDGSATVDPDGSWTYSPDANFNGSDSFTFRADDGSDNSNTATMSITVNPVNDAPVCQDLSLATAKNVAVAGTVNCTDVENDPLVLSIATQPAKGAVFPFDQSTGAFTYTPDTDVTGSDTFTVIANDGHHDSAAALIGIGVDDQAPTCSDASPASANEDTQQAGNLACTDPDNDTLFYGIVGQPAHGTAAINTTSGHWTYTPDADYNGTDSFTAGATDGALDSNAATVSVTIDAVNDAPRCTPATSSGDEETQQTGTVTCTDPEGDSITYVKGTGPATGKGAATVAANGDWTYTPPTNFNGTASFTYTASSNGPLTATTTLTLTVVDVNDPPVAKFDAKSFTVTTTATIPVTTNDVSGPFLGGVTSEPSDTVTVTAATGAHKGTLSIAAGGHGVVYDPRGCASGDDTFSYTIMDSHGATATASVFVTLNRPGTAGLSTKPITDTPALSFINGSTIGSTTPMKLSWCGALASGKLKSYRVDQSTNGGSSYKTLLKATKSTSSTRNLGTSSRYRWRAQTTDTRARKGAYRASLVSRLGRVEDASSSVVYGGSWLTHSTSSVSGGTERYTTTAGDSATVTVGTTVRAFAIVGPRSTGRGSFQVYVDGVAVATVSEKVSGSTLYKRVLYTRSLTPGATHTIAVVASGNGRVDLDAFLTLGS